MKEYIEDRAIKNEEENLQKIPMEEYLSLDKEKIEKIVNMKLRFIRGEIDKEEAKVELREFCDKITAQEFAVCEQYLQEFGISDNQLSESMEELLEIFEGLFEESELNLPKGHPIQTYLEELKEISKLLRVMEEKLQRKFIKNEWLEIYEKLEEINIHFSRKQNQLFSALEKKGFDKPSKIMWTLDNQIKEKIKIARNYLHAEEENPFLEMQREVIRMLEDMIVKEKEVLFPTSMELLSEEEFIQMRKGDDEIGYCLIDPPAAFGTLHSPNREKEQGRKETGESDILDVSQGKMTLEQINLVFKHLPVDLSYVDENDIVKFYSDTKERIFPRSKGVIGREVRNCHPKESVETVEEIIRAFRSGEQDKAEFWLEIGGKFIYIIYNAVRDENGKFRGILEMMQDVTEIRKLSGSQRLLSWKEKSKEEKSVQVENPYHITEDTMIAQLVEEYPFIKKYLLELSPKFSKLKNPILFKMMSSVANIKMVSERGEIPVEDFISKIVAKIDENKK